MKGVMSRAEDKEEVVDIKINNIDLSTALRTEESYKTVDEKSILDRNYLIKEMMSKGIIVNGLKNEKKGMFDFSYNRNQEILDEVVEEVWEEDEEPKRRRGIFQLLNRRK